MRTYQPEAFLEKEDPEKSIRSLDEIEHQALIETLKQTRGNKTEAAKALEITRTTLNNKIRKYGIDLEKVLAADRE
ncbi:MAG: helix-turn-helix domain-containing protein [Desulfobacteraceae bacterium]